MRKLLLSIYCLFCVVTLGLAQTGSGNPIKYISSCEIDLNADSLPDLALLIETIKSRELIVLIRTDSSYNAFLVKKEIPQNMFLSCHFGSEIKETKAGEGKNRKQKIYKTPGTYLELFYPEGPSYGYYWDGKKFQEVWLKD